MDINLLIKRFINAPKFSRIERVAAYELALLACDLYAENERLRKIIEESERLLLTPQSKGV